MPATGREHDVPRHRGIDTVSLAPPLPDWLRGQGVPGLPGGSDPWGESQLAPWLGDPALQQPDLSGLAVPTPAATTDPCPAPCGAWEPEWVDDAMIAAGLAGPFAVPDPRQHVQDRALARDTGYSPPGSEDPAATGDRVGVYLGSGEAYVTAVDLTAPGRGFDWRLERRWRSGAAFDGPLGQGWSLSFDRKMVRVGADNLAAVDPGLGPIAAGDWLRLDGYGRVDRYALVPGQANQWLAPEGFLTTLSVDGEGGLVERDRRGVRARYLPPDDDGIARLNSLADGHGNTMQMLYDGEGRLQTIEDTYGRPITFRWGGDGAEPRLVEVEDFAGRLIRYEYDGQGRLTGVVGPMRAPGPGAGLRPRVRRYAYDPEPDGSGIHRLRTVSVPALDEAAATPPRVRLDYAADGQLLALNLGSPNDPDLPSGGALLYRRRPGEDGIATWVDVTDENGRRVDYGLDAAGRLLRRRVVPDRVLDPEAPSEWTTRYNYGPTGLLSEMTLPEGTQLRWTYDGQSSDPLAKGNLLAEARIADRTRGDAQAIVTQTWRYEPVYRRVVAVTDPRGHDPQHVPPLGGANSPARYTITRTLDYQESMDLGALAQAAGLPLVTLQQRLEDAGTPLDLGDLNGDGRTDGLAGDVVSIRWPDVSLDEDLRLSALYAAPRQAAIGAVVWDAAGRPVAWTDPEGNRTYVEYHPADDPDGDGRDRLPDRGEEPLGLPAARVRDADPAEGPGAPPTPTATATPGPTNTPSPTTTGPPPSPTPSPTTVAPATSTPTATSGVPAASPTPVEASPTAPGPTITPGGATATAPPPISPTPGATASASPRPSATFTSQGGTIYLPTTQKLAEAAGSAGDAVPGAARERIDAVPAINGSAGTGQSIAPPRSALRSVNATTPDSHQIAQEARPAAARPAQQPTPVPLARNGGAGGDFLAVREDFGYDELGRLNRWVDGRGVAFERRLDDLGAVIVASRAVDVSDALSAPEGPTWSACQDAGLPECNAMTVVDHQTRLFYDADGLPVRREIDHFGAPTEFPADRLAPATVVDERRHDRLGRIVEERRLLGDAPEAFLAARTHYDRAGNPILVQSPLSVLPAGAPRRQVAAVRATIFDAHDLPAVRTEGGLPERFSEKWGHEGLDATLLAEISASPAARPATDRWWRSGTAKTLRHAHPADEGAPGEPVFTRFAYDGLDRVRSIVDPVGGQELFEYDAAGRLRRWSRYGATSGPSPIGSGAATIDRPLIDRRMLQTLLARRLYLYDERGRMLGRDDLLDDYRDVQYLHRPVLRDGPLVQAGDGWVSNRWEHDRNSRLVWTHSDDASSTEWRYDGLHRLATMIDAEENRIEWRWDGAGMLLEATRTWRPRPRDIVLGRMPERDLRYSTHFLFDSLGRPVRAMDIYGDAVRWRWDSLDRLVAIQDARHDRDRTSRILDPLGQLPAVEDRAGDPLPNARLSRPGNTTLLAWDAAGRRISELRTERTGGVATGALDSDAEANPDGQIVVDYAWDANGRLIAVADDGTQPEDDNDTPALIEDGGAARGNVTRMVWDIHGRQSATVFDDNETITYERDIAGRIRGMVDANGSVLTRTLDRLGRPVQDEIVPGTGAGWVVSGTRQTRYEWDGLDRLTEAEAEGQTAAQRQNTFRAYDSLGNVLEERSGDLLVSREYAGRGTLLRLNYPDNMSLRNRIDRLGRIEEREQVDAPSLEPALTLIAWLGPRAAESTRPDGSRRSLLRPDLPPDGIDQQLAGLDLVGREVAAHTRGPAGTPLLAFTRTFGADGLLASRRAQPDTRSDVDFDYDSLGRLAGLSAPGGQARSWRLDGAGNRRRFEENDWQVNTRHAYVGIETTVRRHDGNGNLVDDGQLRYQWDYADRLVGIERLSDGRRLAHYRYDALGRLVGRTIYDQSGLPAEIFHLHDDRTVIEDRAGERHELLRRYLFGRSIGAPGVEGDAELVAVDVVLDADGIPDDRYFTHLDPRGDLVALTARRVELDAEEREVARLELIARTTLDAWGAPQDDDLPSGIPRRFAGLARDPETGLYRADGRLYDPATGRWLQPHPAGGWQEPWALGNPYAFEGHRPIGSDTAPERWPRGVVPPEPRAALLAPPNRWLEQRGNSAFERPRALTTTDGPTIITGALAPQLPSVAMPTELGSGRRIAAP